MMFFIVLVGALIVWAVIGTVVAVSRDGGPRAVPLDSTRSLDEARRDFPLTTDPHFFVR